MAGKAQQQDLDAQHPSDSLEQNLEFAKFAEELFEAHPDGEIASTFIGDLRLHVASKWSFRSAMKNNGLVRAAAMLLITLTGSVPVLAIIAMVVQAQPEKTSIGFNLPKQLPQIENPQAPDPALKSPTAQELDDLLDEEWLAELHSDNRNKQFQYVLHTTLSSLMLLDTRLKALSVAWPKNKE